MVYKLKLAILVLGIIQIGPLIIVSPLVVWSWTHDSDRARAGKRNSGLAHTERMHNRAVTLLA